MNVNLRKAAGLHTAVVEALKGALVAHIQINKFDAPTPAIERHTQTLTKDVEKKINLLNAQFVLRNLISKANEQKVNLLLTEQADLARRVVLFESLLVATNTQASFDVIKGSHAALQAPATAPTTTFLYNVDRFAAGAGADAIAVGLITPEMAAIYKHELLALKRAQQSLKDTLLGVNLTTEITIPDTTVATLKDASII